jgi:hypothetical protein
MCEKGEMWKKNARKKAAKRRVGKKKRKIDAGAGMKR